MIKDDFYDLGDCEDDYYHSYIYSIFYGFPSYVHPISARPRFIFQAHLVHYSNALKMMLKLGFTPLPFSLFLAMAIKHQRLSQQEHLESYGLQLAFHYVEYLQHH